MFKRLKNHQAIEIINDLFIHNMIKTVEVIKFSYQNGTHEKLKFHTCELEQSILVLSNEKKSVRVDIGAYPDIFMNDLYTDNKIVLDLEEPDEKGKTVTRLILYEDK